MVSFVLPGMRRTVGSRLRRDMEQFCLGYTMCLLYMCITQGLTREVGPLEYVYPSVGIPQNLGPFVMELNRHLAQDAERLEEGPEKGRAFAGLTAASCLKVSQQVNSNPWELWRGWCFPYTLQDLPRISFVAQPTWKHTGKRIPGNVAWFSQYDTGSPQYPHGVVERVVGNMGLELREEVQARGRHSAVIRKPRFMKPWKGEKVDRE